MDGGNPQQRQKSQYEKQVRCMISILLSDLGPIQLGFKVKYAKGAIDP
jgi:hypothetical protein